MPDTKQQRHGASAPTIAFIAFAAAAAAVGVLALNGSPGNHGNAQADAAPVATTVPDAIASPEAHGAFIRQSHERAAREGDPSPLPATF